MSASSPSSLSVELLSCHFFPPGVDIQCQPGEYAGESKGKGKIEDIVLPYLERGGEYKILWSLLIVMREQIAPDKKSIKLIPVI